jgi:tellurite methyltransferase
MSDARSRWDARYADGDWVDLSDPIPTLRDAVRWVDPGRALDIASGAGRNARFLAQSGWSVVAVDLSLEGLRQMGRIPGVLPVLADVEHFELRDASVDLVVNSWFLQRSIFPLIRRVLRPGGILVFETFSVIELDELGGDIRRAFALERGELLRAFDDFAILRHEEGVFDERGVARMIARKPVG